MKRFVLDTSALVKAYVQEEGTPRVRELFSNAPAGSLFVCRVAHPEAAPAIARREREGRLSFEEANGLLIDLELDLNGHEAIYAVIEVTLSLASGSEVRAGMGAARL